MAPCGLDMHTTTWGMAIVTKRGRGPDLGWNPTSSSEDSEEGAGSESSLVPILDS